MNPWVAKAIVLAGSAVLVAIRAPHGQRSRSVTVVRSLKGPRETILLTLAWAGFFLPFVWIATSGLAFADYPLRPLPLAAGTALMALGLWVFYRSHADLGTNWSITLEVRENHRLVTEGVYRRVRHPMYLALLLLSVGQALVVPNWVAGPAYLASLAILLAFRLGREEQMMVAEFGGDYEAYRARTKRLFPGVW